MIIHGPRRFRGLLLSVVTVLLCLSTDAYASPFEKFSDGLIVRQDETLQGDLYFTTTTADIQGHVIGDLSGFTAYDFNITGTVDGDVNICGQSVTLSGTIQDSLRSWTNNTTISGTVERDVMIFAGSVTLLPSAHIKGKLTAFGGTVSLRGTIDGDVMVTAGTINIDSQMGGDVRLEADKIDVRPESHIVGDLNYVARSAPPEDLADRVGGELKFDEKGAKRDRAQTEKPAFAPLNWLGRWIWKTLVLFIIGCLVMVPLRRVDAGAALIRPLQTQAMLGGLIGFFGVIVLPIIAFLLVVLLIAVPMAVIFGFPEAFIGVLFSFPPLLAVVAVLLFVAQVPAVYWVGTHIQPTMIVWRTDERPSVHRARSVYLSMFLGAALVRLLATIPYIGWLVSLGVVWLGLGTTILAIHAALQRTTPSTNATV